MKSTESPWNFFEDFENEEEGELKRILLEKGSDEMLYIDEQTKKFRKRYINNNLTINDKGVGSEPFRIKKDPDGNQYLEIKLKHGWNWDPEQPENGAKDTERAQLQAVPKDAQEKEMWISFKMRLPLDFVHIDKNKTKYDENDDRNSGSENSRVSVFEFKNLFKKMKKSPLLGIKYYKNGNELKIGGDTGGIAYEPQNKKERVLHHIAAKYEKIGENWIAKWEENRRFGRNGLKEMRKITTLEPVSVTPLGEWSTFKIGIYNTRSQKGFVKLWKDNQLMFNYHGITFDWEGTYMGTYIRIGIYRDSGSNAGTEFHDQTIDFDDFIVVSDEKTLDQILSK